MNFRKPKFWDNKKFNLYSFFLFPLTIFIEINNLFLSFKKNKPKNKIKSICVGNIYVGGTGKTPTTIKIYQILKKLGFSTSVGKKKYINQVDEMTILKSQVHLITGDSRKEILNNAKKNIKK